MWRLKSVYIENIVSFKEAQLEIEQGVATLIFGRNEDNASQPCNGSGKSSLIEAISFGLTGEQLRKVKSVEEIINDHSDEAYVQLVLENSYDNTVLMIERTISRNNPQSIECHKYGADGEEIEKDKTVQPSVADYNKFILGEIGLTKDDIYNNYILCDNKYESFFDCSDRSKKEIINSFSNVTLVDESIARVQADMEPISEKLNESALTMSGIQGSIDALQRELEDVDVKKKEEQLNRQSRITFYDEKITECRENIEKYKKNLQSAKERFNKLSGAHDFLDELEKLDQSLIDEYHQILQYFDVLGLSGLSDYEATMKDMQRQIEEKQKFISNLTVKMAVFENDVKSLQRDYDEKYASYQANVEKSNQKSEEEEKSVERLNNEIDELDKQLDKLEDEIKILDEQNFGLNQQIASIKNKLHGKITCPKCNHQFILGEDENVEDLQENMKKLEKTVGDNHDKIEKLNDDVDKLDREADYKSRIVKRIGTTAASRKEALYKDYNEICDMKKEVDDIEDKITMLKARVSEHQINIDKLNGKMDVLRNRMYGEATGILDGNLLKGETYISQTESSISFAEGQMKQYQKSKKELLEAPATDFESSLRKSLEQCENELREAENANKAIKKQYNELKEQETNFTMFKSYLAKKKIDALSLIVNDFLEKIGSDIRLRLEGFSMTKTGKLRDKISVQVTRDGVDCGSYHKFSGGEKARLNLACILSLHTLTNANCEDGKGLDFIIIDELLDKSDEVGMATYCDALNKLHQTSLLITQGAISEGYPHKLLVTKRQGFSTISK